jgi:hypothetical protein
VAKEGELATAQSNNAELTDSVAQLQTDLDVLREDLRATKLALKSMLPTHSNTVEECLDEVTEFHNSVITA